MRQTLHGAMIAEDVPARFARWNGSKSNLALRLRLAFTKILMPGGHLPSRTVSSAVLSAVRVFTVVFGMGTGVSPGRIAARFPSAIA